MSGRLRSRTPAATPMTTTQGAFLVSIRSDEDGLRIDVEHSTRGNRLDSDWIEGADLAQAKARAETMMARFVERWRAYHAEHWRQHDADTEGDAG